MSNVRKNFGLSIYTPIINHKSTMSVTLHTLVTPLLGGAPVRRSISLNSYEDFVCLEEAMGQVSFSNGAALELSESELRLAELIRNKGYFSSPMWFYDEEAEEVAALFRLTSKVRRRLDAIAATILLNGSASKNS